MTKSFTISDGRLTLTLREEPGGWYTVRSPIDPAMITQARNLREAFDMARDAFGALAASRRKRAREQRPADARRRPRSRAAN